MKTTRKVAGAGAVLAATALIVTGCTGPGADGGEASVEDQKLLIWSWDANMDATVAAYKDANPDADVEVENVGTGNDQYIALQNAISAGEGFPDLVFLEGYAMPQFALSGALADLGPLGADSLAEAYAPGPWAASQVNDTVYSLPWASGPMVMFYNHSIFDRLGVDVPTTWDEYVGAAEALHTADPSVYILNDVGNAGLAESLIWSAGGEPFRVDGEKVSVDLADQGTTRYAETWQRLIDEDLLAPVADWTDDWTKMLNADQIATLPAGSWMGGTLQGIVPEGSGKWSVAQLPQWDAGVDTAAEHGGGGFAVLEQSQNKELAFDFAEFATAGAGVDVIREVGLWPSAISAVEDPAFLGQEVEYFGGQTVNEEYAEASANVPDGFQFLPFQVYANGIYNDTVGQAYNKTTTVAEGLGDWQSALLEYGEQQGFTVD